MSTPAPAQIRELMQSQLPADLFAHTLATTEYALELAKLYGCDSGEMRNIELGALLHDNCKHWEQSPLIVAASELGYTPDVMELRVPALLHARIGAFRLWRDFGVNDTEAYAAVYFHTVGGRGMSRAARIVYCADKLEAGRSFPGVNDLRANAGEGLTELCLAVIGANLEYLRGNRRLIHPATLEFYNELVQELSGLE